jgi:hypothetical protein
MDTETLEITSFPLHLFNSYFVDSVIRRGGTISAAVEQKDKSTVSFIITAAADARAEIKTWVSGYPRLADMAESQYA